MQPRGIHGEAHYHPMVDLPAPYAVVLGGEIDRHRVGNLVLHAF